MNKILAVMFLLISVVSVGSAIYQNMTWGSYTLAPILACISFSLIGIGGKVVLWISRVFCWMFTLGLVAGFLVTVKQTIGSDGSMVVISVIFPIALLFSLTTYRITFLPQPMPNK